MSAFCQLQVDIVHSSQHVSKDIPVTTLTRSIIASRVAEETGIWRSDVDLVSRRMLALIGAALGRGRQ